MAGTDTTSIEGGDGDDVIIGGPNVVLVTGGDGWDYIVGKSEGAVLMGGSGDDIIDAGEVPASKDVGSDVEDQLELVAMALPQGDASKFANLVEEQIETTDKAAILQERDSVDVELRQHAIDDSTLVQGVLNSADTVDQNDEELMAEIEALQEESEAYAATTKAFAERTEQEATVKSKTMQEAAAKSSLTDISDVIHGLANHDDFLYGGRGGDDIYGDTGDDLLYGGTDDDELYGEGDDDYMLGGMGADKINGDTGNDIAQGDTTGDKMWDSGNPLIDVKDVLSFASGGTNGFADSMSGFPNFPSTTSPERGVHVDLSATGNADNGSVSTGGGTDVADTDHDKGTDFADFESVVGTPFADYIVGDTGANVLQGGGGADVIRGGGGSGADVFFGDTGGDNLVAPNSSSWLLGGSGEDYCGGTTIVVECESKPSNWVGVRDAASISVGMTTQSWAGHVKSQLYMAGSSANWVTRNGEDEVTVVQVDDSSGPPSYYFLTEASSSKGQFSVQPQDQTPGCSYSATLVICSPSTNVTTMVLAGFGSNDEIYAASMYHMTSTFILGGDGHDTLTGGTISEDFMSDGSGDDHLYGGGADDGLVNTGGQDEVWAQDGDDLVLSDSACEGDVMGGSYGRDSATWVKFQSDVTAGSTNGVFADLNSGWIGNYIGGVLTCGSSTKNSMNGFEDLEGSRHRDFLQGDDDANQLIGRGTGDLLKSYDSNDRILANSADDDDLYCGGATDGDVAVIDDPANGHDTTDGYCDDVYERDPIFPGT
ncbi:MAG: hypothetical protein JJE13_08945 [Thermoleophilia bacterium]|nr:hypothetical protein [Thermoleophilia bacterium]